MGVDCGSQALLCEYPIRFDTYSGCSHGCRYCFAQAKVKLDEIKIKNSVQGLRNFISGKRGYTTTWCDFPIPLHWGGLSDPFQPLEKRGGVSLKCLEVFAETQYPVIISTKGKLLSEEPYISLLAKCNAVVQVSMLSSSFDKLETGAPTFEDRLEMLAKFSANSKRTIVRAQPYIIDICDELISNLPRMKQAGAYGITVEGMKFKKSKPGTVRVGGDFCYPESRLKADYEKIRTAAHTAGLAFFCAENRLRPMGDSYACCGCGDLDGFAGNAFNAVSLINGREVFPTQRMKDEGTGGCFKAIDQSAGNTANIKRKPFAKHIIEAAHSQSFL